MHWFIDPIKNHYFDFDGRATRQEFWMFVLLYFIVSIVVGIVEGVLGTMFLGTILTLALFLPSIAITARRLHDIGKSGWWQLIFIIPLVGLIIMIIWCATKGNEGPNAYGPAAGASSAPMPEASGGHTPAPEPNEPAHTNENTQQGY